MADTLRETTAKYIFGDVNQDLSDDNLITAANEVISDLPPRSLMAIAKRFRITGETSLPADYHVFHVLEAWATVDGDYKLARKIPTLTEGYYSDYIEPVWYYKQSDTATGLSLPQINILPNGGTFVVVALKIIGTGADFNATDSNIGPLKLLKDIIAIRAAAEQVLEVMGLLLTEEYELGDLDDTPDLDSVTAYTAPSLTVTTTSISDPSGPTLTPFSYTAFTIPTITSPSIGTLSHTPFTIPTVSSPANIADFSHSPGAITSPTEPTVPADSEYPSGLTVATTRTETTAEGSSVTDFDTPTSSGGATQNIIGSTDEGNIFNYVPDLDGASDAFRDFMNNDDTEQASQMLQRYMHMINGAHAQIREKGTIPEIEHVRIAQAGQVLAEKGGPVQRFSAMTARLNLELALAQAQSQEKINAVAQKINRFSAQMGQRVAKYGQDISRKRTDFDVEAGVFNANVNKTLSQFGQNVQKYSADTARKRTDFEIDAGIFRENTNAQLEEFARNIAKYQADIARYRTQFEVAFQEWQGEISTYLQEYAQDINKMQVEIGKANHVLAREIQKYQAETGVALQSAALDIQRAEYVMKNRIMLWNNTFEQRLQKIGQKMSQAQFLGENYFHRLRNLNTLYARKRKAYIRQSRPYQRTTYGRYQGIL